jgi:hypothetical protein
MTAVLALRGATSSRMRGNFVLLRADSLRLLLPQQDVISTEYIESTPSATSEPGIFTHAEDAGMQRKVLAFSGEMHAMTIFPSDRILLTQLADDQHDISFAWSEVRVLIDTELERHALPVVMQGPAAMVDSYLELDGELVFVSNAQQLISHAIDSLA